MGGVEYVGCVVQALDATHTPEWRGGGGRDEARRGRVGLGGLIGWAWDYGAGIVRMLC